MKRFVVDVEFSVRLFVGLVQHGTKSLDHAAGGAASHTRATWVGTVVRRTLGTHTQFTAVVALLAGLLSALATLVTTRLIHPEPRLAIVDLPAIIADHVTTPTVAAMADDVRATHAAQFARQLEAEVAEVARQYNALLLTAPAVVAGAPDLTPVIRARLAGARESAGDRR